MCLNNALRGGEANVLRITATKLTYSFQLHLY